MPPTQRRSSSTSSDPKRSAPTKFIPNMTQLQEALKDLPDPELWSEKTCSCSIIVEKKQKFIEFVRKRINRGSSHPYRWVYEGKILIRKRDT